MGIFFDFLDGFFARLLKVETDLGIQLDSMADVITSALLPGIIVSQLFVLSGNQSLIIDLSIIKFEKIELVPWSIGGFVLTLAAVNRLAKFNLDIEQSKKKDFRGLPAPATAIFFGALPILMNNSSFLFLKPILLSNITLIFSVIFFALLMNSNFHFFSLKSFEKSFFDKLFQIVLISMSFVFLLLYGLAGFTIIICVYLLLNFLKIGLKKYGFSRN